jgi:hypothetical protein
LRSSVEQMPARYSTSLWHLNDGVRQLGSELSILLNLLE